MSSRGGYKNKRKPITPNSAEKPQKKALMTKISQHSNEADREADTSTAVQNIHMASAIESDEMEHAVALPLSKKDIERMMYSHIKDMGVEEKDTSLCNVLVSLISNMTDLVTRGLRKELIQEKREKNILHEKIHKLENKVEFLEMQVAEGELYSKRSNLIISGVPETPDETNASLLTWFQKLIKTLNIHWREDMVVVIHRSRKRGKGPKDIIVQLDNQNTKKAIYKERFNLRKKDGYQSVYINGHYPYLIKEQRKVLQAVATEARTQYPQLVKNISVYENVLYINNIFYP